MVKSGKRQLSIEMQWMVKFGSHEGKLPIEIIKIS